METYAQKLLEKSGQLRRVAGRTKKNVKSVACAFCRSTGRHPKMDSLCPVCCGSKKLLVNPPVVTCLICHGTGTTPGETTCLSCKGIGVVSVPKNAGTCKKCRGTGYQGEGIFSCTACKGQGIC